MPSVLLAIFLSFKSRFITTVREIKAYSYSVTHAREVKQGLLCEAVSPLTICSEPVRVINPSLAICHVLCTATTRTQSHHHCTQHNCPSHEKTAEVIDQVSFKDISRSDPLVDEIYWSEIFDLPQDLEIAMEENIHQDHRQKATAFSQVAQGQNKW